MAKAPLSKIVEMLSDADDEKRVAAALVLGEIKARGPEVQTGLIALLDDSGPARRYALRALARIGARKAKGKIFPLLATRDKGVREAAIAAIVSMGDDVVTTLSERRVEAGIDERRAIDAVLAQLGGTDAFSSLLSGLSSSSEDAAAASASTFKQTLESADRPTRAAHLRAILRALNNTDSAIARQTLVKMIGFFHDPKTTPKLLEVARANHEDARVRQEALIALRFAARDADKKTTTKIAGALVDAAEAEDRALAQTALLSLGSIPLPAGLAERLAGLAAHEDDGRATFVIQMLGHRDEAAAVNALLASLQSGPHRRMEAAARALESKSGLSAMLVQALADTDDPLRVRPIAKLLMARPDDLTTAQKKSLHASMTWWIDVDDGAFTQMAELAFRKDSAGTTDLLRALQKKLKRSPSRSDERLLALRALGRSRTATPEDHYALAATLLMESALDPRKSARASDPALNALLMLSGRGFTVGRSLTKDKSLTFEAQYYVGFHFAEAGHPLGEELLEHVAQKAGRRKIARDAKNKLKLLR